MRGDISVHPNPQQHTAQPWAWSVELDDHNPAHVVTGAASTETGAVRAAAHATTADPCHLLHPDGTRTRVVPFNESWPRHLDQDDARRARSRREYPR